MAAGIIILGGTLLLPVLGTRFIWRGINRSSMGAVRNMILGVLLVALGRIALLFWPQVVAQRMELKRITDRLDGVTLTVEPGR